MFRVKIGVGCVLCQDVHVGGKAVLGNNVRVQNNVSIYDRVSLADYIFCCPSMVFTNVINPRKSVNRKDEYLETRLGKGASFIANAPTIYGNEIGEYAFIGAGSEVTKPVLAYDLMVGNPAKKIGWMSSAGVRLKIDEYVIGFVPRRGSDTRLRMDLAAKINFYMFHSCYPKVIL